MGNSASRNDVPEIALVLLEHLEWKERGYAAMLSRSWRKFMSTDMMYRWLCNRLSIEKGIYNSLRPIIHSSWRKLFLDMYGLRNLWTSKYSDAMIESIVPNQSKQSERFKVNVFSRFRPYDENNNSESSGLSITLPLHQRLGLIKLSYGVKTKKHALKILKEEGNWFGKKWADIESSKENNSSNMNTNSKHISSSELLKASVQNIDAGSGRVVMVAPDVGLREFSFDGVFPPTSTQKHIYEVTTQNLVSDVINGFNATVIMYGQTSSGKVCIHITNMYYN
jgi:hypothetical protein